LIFSGKCFFPSPEFLFVFLPVTLVVFFVLAKLLPQMVAASWLTLSSLVFYGWWNPRYVILLLLSISFNFSVGQAIRRGRRRSPDLARLMLIIGLAGDLGLLGYYKYANFFVSSREPLVRAAGN
jgi:alginate O-acetyltransferase complex protein AlgI